ncbi:hypothetical protein ACFQV4_25275 [Streptomyces thermocarboxydus]
MTTQARTTIPATCSRPGRAYCERGQEETGTEGALPEFTPGGELLDASNAIVTDEDQAFAAFLADMKKAGSAGRAPSTPRSPPGGGSAVPS